MINMHSKANRIFKELRAVDWIHGDISRRKATKAIFRVLEMEIVGEESPPASKYPFLHLFLNTESKYSSDYINKVFGVYRYLRGDYIGDNNERNTKPIR